MGDQIRDINVRVDGSTGIPAPGNPVPGAAGTLNGYPTGPQTTVQAWWFNMVQEEQRNLILAMSETPQTNHVHQLAEAFEQAQGPGLGTMAIVRSVAIGDISVTSGAWSRVGRRVTMHQEIAWLNTNNGIEGEELLIEIPWEVAPGQHMQGHVSSSGNLQDDGGYPYYAVLEKAEAPNPRSLRITYSVASGLLSGNLNGGAQTPVTIGGEVVDGGANPRSIRIWCTYWTNGNWNPAWPRVQWDVVGDQPAPSAPSLTYYGAQAGDNISVRDDDDVEVQSLPVGGLPTDTISPGVLGVGRYTLLHRGYRSRPITIGQAI